MPPQVSGGRTVNTMPPEVRRLKWAQFIAGNVFSVGTVYYELATLDICFEDDDDLKIHDEVAGRITVALVYGAAFDVVSALVLSCVYRSPVDGKSAHKIPSEDNRGHCSTCMIRCATPFMWGLICAFVGFASIQYGDHPACDPNGPDWLDGYLWISGGVLIMLGFAFLLPFMVVLLPIFAFCCQRARTCTKKLLWTFPFIDLLWQLQSVIWSYRSGSIGLTEAATLGLFTGSGHYLAEIGSFVISNETLGIAAA